MRESMNGNDGQILIYEAPNTDYASFRVCGDKVYQKNNCNRVPKGGRRAIGPKRFYPPP